MTIMACAFALAPDWTGLAEDACPEPPAPAPVDGAQVSEDQMRAAAAAARDFIAQSDVYQVCLANAVDAARTQAAADGKSFDQAVEIAARARADANQKVKERVGAEINTAISIYKQTHLK
jgi:hypothetical protein